MLLGQTFYKVVVYGNLPVICLR